MGSFISLTAADGYTFSAYEAKPSDKCHGALVVLQEIFGVNAHIQSVCDSFAEAGFHTLAPALFDRVAPGLTFSYDGNDRDEALKTARQKLHMPNTLQDIQTTVNALSQSHKVGIVGYCFGGLLCWLSAAKVNNIQCAVSYYGGGIAQQLSITPTVPTIFHFGKQDPMIPTEDIEALSRQHPNLPIYLYDAGHGFNCDIRANHYDEAAAMLARSRTLLFLNEHLNAL